MPNEREGRISSSNWLKQAYEFAIEFIHTTLQTPRTRKKSGAPTEY